MRTLEHRVATFALLMIGSAAASSAPADDPENLFWDDSTLSFDVRLRYERAQDQAADDAEALTLRSALEWQTGPIGGATGLFGSIELENTTLLSASNYSDGLRNRGTALIADSSSTEVNQLFLSYQFASGLTAKVGRQSISYGDERFVGTVAFRQNNQSFDAVSLAHSGIENWKLAYSYVTNVNRIFGDRANNGPDGLLGDHEQNTHLANVVYDGWSIGSLESYAYLIDNEDFQRASTDTYGLRFSGSARPQRLSYLYTLEYAHQRSDDDNLLDYQTDYWRIVGGVSFKRISLKLAQERLGGANGAGFVTPLATLHRYQGWADKFVASTPAQGLINNSITLAGRWPGFRYRIQYHDYRVKNGSRDIGTEIGLHLQYRFRQKYFVEVKYADYRGREAASGVPNLDADTRRLFLTLSASFGEH